MIHEELGREIPPEGPEELTRGQFLYVLGEAPGQNEDRVGRAFVGSSGNLLWRLLRQFGISRSQCRVANVFWRRPPNNNIEIVKRLPEWAEYCQKTREDILKSQPRAILALGRTALELLFGDQFKISEIRGYWLTWNDIPVMPTYHPASVLRFFSHYFPFASDLKKLSLYLHNLTSLPKSPPSIFQASEDHFLSLLNKALQDDLPIALDIEVSQGETWTCDLIGLAVHLDGNPVSANTFPTKRVLTAVKTLASQKPHLAIFHNATFDLTWLYGEFAIEFMEAPHDTMLMHHILLPDQPKSLEFCSSIWLSIPAWKFLSETSITYYNAMDCIATLLLYRVLESELKSRGYWEVYDRQKRREILPAVFMGYLGLGFDPKAQEDLRSDVQSKMEALRASMEALFPEVKTLNLNSEKQLKLLLYERWKLPPKTEKGKITTRETALRDLLRSIKDRKPKEAKFLELYLEWKALSSILSKELKLQPHPWTQRIHTTFNVAGTETARWSSSAPLFCSKGSKTIGGTNLQNRSKPYRKQFLPPFRGWIFLCADYSGAEARIVAWRCNDEESKKAFQRGEDIHVLTASMMFGKSPQEISQEERRIGKTIRHASNYDMSWRKLSQIMQISASQAKDLLERYHSAFPKVRAVFHRKTAELVQRERRLIDAWGLPRFFTGRLNDPDTLREAYAFYPQSTCTHTLNKALLKLWDFSKEKSWCALALQVHDEIVMVCEANHDAVLELAEAMKEAMEIEIPIFDLDTEQISPLVLPIEFKLGANWGELIEFSSPKEAPSVLDMVKDHVKPFDTA